MNLNKFLRKHTRALLMVFMSLLLVAFLIPQQIQGCGERRYAAAMKRGEAFGESISTTTLEGIRQEMHLLTIARFPVPPVEALEYYLMMLEAEHLGVRVGRDEVVSMLKQAGRTDADLQQIQARSRWSYDQIYDAIGRLLAVQRLMSMHWLGVVRSLPREEAAYRDQNQEAVAQLSVIDSRAFVQALPEPTEEEAQAFFEECKDRTTAHTDKALVYGYRNPDRVVVEVLTVDPAEVEKHIQVTSSQINQFYEENKHLYMKNDPAGTADAQGRIPQIPMTLEEARPQLREDVRRARAVEAAQSMINEMYAEAVRPWGVAPRDQDGFLPRPEGDLVSFEALQERYSRKYPVQYERVDVPDKGGMASALAMGFERSIVTGHNQLKAPQLAVRVKGVLSADPKDRLPVLNVMEPAPVVLSMTSDPRSRQQVPHQAYLFRVVEVTPSAPPASLDEVREQLVRDWKQYKAFEIAGQRAEALAARAREIGLAAAVEEAVDLKMELTAAEAAAAELTTNRQFLPKYVESLTPFTPANLTRKPARGQPVYIRELGVVPSVPEAIFALVDEPSAESAPAHQVTDIPLASNWRWVVAEVESVKPLYAGAFEAQLRGMPSFSQYQERQLFGFAWRMPEKVQQRTGFISAQGTARPADEPNEPEAP